MADYDHDLIGDSCIGDDSDSEGIDTPASEESAAEKQDEIETKFAIPDWFLDQNIKLSQSLRDAPLEIVEKKDLRKEEPSKKDQTKSENKSEKDGPKSEDLSEKDQLETRKPQLSKDKYQEAHDIIAGSLRSNITNDASVTIYGKKRKDEAILNSLVDVLAGHLGADLLSVTFEDLADLSETWYSKSPEKDDASTKPDVTSTFGLTEYYFGVQSAKRVSDEAKERNQQVMAALFTTVETRRTNEASTTKVKEPADTVKVQSEAVPTLVYLQNGNKTMQDGRDGFKILSRFRQAVQERRRNNQPTLLVVSVFGEEEGLECWHDKDTYFCDGGNCATLRKKLRTDISALIRVKPSDYSLPEDASDPGLAKTNLKNLSRYVCRKRKDVQTRTLFDSLAQAIDPEDEKITRSFKVLGGPDWTSDELQRAARQICGRSVANDAVEIDDIANVLQAVRKSAGKKDEKEDDDDSLKGLSVKERIARVKEDDDLNKYESILFDKIVDPEELIYTYDDVIMDDETKATVKQLIKFANIKLKGSSRLLQQIKIKGMLFYGPPGTGKTHLVRAIAKDSNAVMLAVDPSAINNKYCGESEKMISAIFTLAAKLHPCVVFIDEVDALFYRRSSEDKSWQRSQLTQFLQDMDGIGTQKNSPIVITATNRPKDLDDAFLRRLPQKVLFKLPGEVERAKILRLFLQPEDLDPEVDVDALAKSTAGFSGSDLKNLCAQAALIWAVDAAEAGTQADEEVEVLLKNTHIERARQRTQSTVSSGSQADIDAFAKKFGHAPQVAKQVVDRTDWSKTLMKREALSTIPITYLILY